MLVRKEFGLRAAIGISHTDYVLMPQPAISNTPAETADAVPSTWQRARRRSAEVLGRAQSGDRPSQVADAVLIGLISLSVVSIVLESDVGLYARYKDWFFRFEVLTVAVFTIEYIFRLWSCVDADDSESAHLNPFRRRLKHVLSPAALVDLLAIMPFYLTLAGLAGSADLRVLRAIRLLRVLKLTRYSEATETLVQVLKENVRSFAAAFFLLMVVMLIAATGMYYFENEAQPVAFSSIPSSMWWAFVTLTTVGYGDVTPITTGGRIFGAMITVVGVGMVALPTGILASAYSEQMRVRAEQYRAESTRAYEDGYLSADEVHELESLRESLGLGKHTASQILNTEKVRAALREGEARSHCRHCGATLSRPD